jgi:hypothetical protein
MPKEIYTYIIWVEDWQHFHDGTWLFPIKMKIPLTNVLVILPFIGYLFSRFSRKDEAETESMLTVYTHCSLTVKVLGYFGGKMIFEGEGRPLNIPIRFWPEKSYTP